LLTDKAKEVCEGQLGLGLGLGYHYRQREQMPSIRDWESIPEGDPEIFQVVLLTTGPEVWRAEWFQGTAAAQGHLWTPFILSQCSCQLPQPLLNGPRCGLCTAALSGAS
jgi:hypothetical protein